MAKPGAASTQLPSVPDTPELDRLQAEEVARATDLYYTPGHVHQARQVQRKREENARRIERVKVLARAEAERELRDKAKTSRSTRRTSRRGFLEPHRRLVQDAAVKCNGDVRQFCKLLDLDGVPVPPAWRVGGWLDAYAKGGRLKQGAIRRYKQRYLRAA